MLAAVGQWRPRRWRPEVHWEWTNWTVGPWWYWHSHPVHVQFDLGPLGLSWEVDRRWDLPFGVFCEVDRPRGEVPDASA